MLPLLSLLPPSSLRKTSSETLQTITGSPRLTAAQEPVSGAINTARDASTTTPCSLIQGCWTEHDAASCGENAELRVGHRARIPTALFRAKQLYPNRSFLGPYSNGFYRGRWCQNCTIHFIVREMYRLSNKYIQSNEVYEYSAMSSRYFANFLFVYYNIKI